MPKQLLEHIRLTGVKTHNLKNFDVTIPRNELVIITGVSGSGKSSLAFDTLYAEGQRRYVESLSSYARQFLSIMDKPEVDHIEGLSPAISVEQKSISHNPRSTVGTITEIHDYLRLLFAQVGTPLCPTHKNDLQAQSISQMVDKILALPKDTKAMLLAPVVQNSKGEHAVLLNNLAKQGFVRVRIDGIITALDQDIVIDKNRKHNIEVVVDRIKIKDSISQRIAESAESAVNLAEGLLIISPIDKGDFAEFTLSNRFACTECGYSIGELSPRNFSFNSPVGACKSCDGLGTQTVFDEHKIVSKPHLSIAQGAIHGWEPKNPYLYNLLISVSKHYGFNLDVPFEDLPQDIKHILMHGSQDIIQFRYKSSSGSQYNKKSKFEGILNNIQRRYNDTSSNMSRNLLENTCPLRYVAAVTEND